MEKKLQYFTLNLKIQVNRKQLHLHLVFMVSERGFGRCCDEWGINEKYLVAIALLIFIIQLAHYLM